MKFTDFLMLLLLLMMAATLIWESWLKSATRARRHQRTEARFNRTLREIEARDSELLRQRIIGGADVLALLDRSNCDEVAT